MNKRASTSPELVPLERLYEGMAHAAPDAEREETPEFVEWWRAIMMHKWRILAFACFVATLTYWIVSQADPVYRSTATVLVEPDTAKLVPIGNTYNDGTRHEYREYFQTQAEILKSRAVAQRVVSELKLPEHPEFGARQSRPSAAENWIKAHLPALASLIWKPAPVLDDESFEIQVLKSFANRLYVDPVRQTQLIKVSFEANDARLAAAAANATAEAYIQADLDARYKTSDKSGQLINEQLADLKTTLDASEKALQAYRDREGMLDNKSTVLGGSGRQMEELTHRLVEARVRLSEAEQAYGQVKAGESSGHDSAPAVVKSPSVQQAKEAEAAAERKVAEFSQRYGPGHPNFEAARSDLSAAQANTRRQIQNLVASVAKEYQAARATEKTIEASLARSKGTIQDLNRKEIPLGVLEREAATNRQIYQAFLSSSKETSAVRDAQGSNARLVDLAVPETQPFRPAKRRIVAIAVVLSLFLGIAVSLLMKTLRTTVKTSADVEKKLHHPFLAAMPVLPRKGKRNVGRSTLDHPHDVYAESVRTASTGVLLSALDTPHKIVVVTSSVPEEGKSTFAMNFAFSQSRSKRVVLIEADMRRPCFGKVLNLPPQHKGLSQLIAGTATFDECLIRIDGTNLHVIPAGPLPPHPLELLSSPKFHEVLVMLRDRCDTVIVDSPPVQLVSDALVIGSQATGVIFVVKADDTPTPSVRAGLKRISSANIPVFGVVLNQQDFKKAEKYYGENSSYGKLGYETAYGADAQAVAGRK
ncbi:MAG: polysaccharide biosynthesis tyrosine autokinase [Pseudomonadota bacterium]|nr:polysaccharide biosynthesis tyrosine autokinase [Pseudomonadota bacterium]